MTKIKALNEDSEWEIFDLMEDRDKLNTLLIDEYSTLFENHLGATFKNSDIRKMHHEDLKTLIGDINNSDLTVI